MRKKLKHQKYMLIKEYENIFEKIEKFEKVWYNYTNIERSIECGNTYFSIHNSMVKKLDKLKKQIGRVNEKIKIYL